MLTSSQTTPAVPIGLKKAQENVSGAMGDNPGAHGPQVSSSGDNFEKSLSKKPKKKIPLKYVLGGLILILILIGSGAALYLTQMSQDVRQQASEGPYDNNMIFVEGMGYLTPERFAVLNQQRKDAGLPPLTVNNGQAVSGGTSTPSSGSPGSGDSGECALGDAAAIRACLASKATVYNSGACNGMTEAQCISWCQSNPECQVQTCTGEQQKSGDRQGEFLNCGGSGGTGGCGQVDMLDSSGNLLGFVMDTSGCGSGGAPAATTIVQATTNPTSNPTTEPTTNPTVRPTPTVAPSPTPVVSPSPSPSVSPSPSPVGCGQPCSVSTDCAEANHICYEYADDGNPNGGICRLINNPTSTTCVAPSPSPSPTPKVGCNDACVTSGDCRDTDHVCSSATNTCRLAENPGDANCAPKPSPSPTPAPGCNQTCYKSSECNFANAVCYDNLCRLDSNPVNTACQPKTTTGTYYQQPALPQALPESGSEDILNWLKVGLGALGLGLIFLFL